MEKTTIHHFTLIPRTQRLQLNLRTFFHEQEPADQHEVTLFFSFSSSAASSDWRFFVFVSFLTQIARLRCQESVADKLNTQPNNKYSAVAKSIFASWQMLAEKLANVSFFLLVLLLLRHVANRFDKATARSLTDLQQ